MLSNEVVPPVALLLPLLLPGAGIVEVEGDWVEVEGAWVVVVLGAMVVDDNGGTVAVAFGDSVEVKDGATVVVVVAGMVKLNTNGVKTN